MYDTAIRTAGAAASHRDGEPDRKGDRLREVGAGKVLVKGLVVADGEQPGGVEAWRQHSLDCIGIHCFECQAEVAHNRPRRHLGDGLKQVACRQRHSLSKLMPCRSQITMSTSYKLCIKPQMGRTIFLARVYIACQCRGVGFIQKPQWLSPSGRALVPLTLTTVTLKAMEKLASVKGVNAKFSTVLACSTITRNELQNSVTVACMGFLRYPPYMCGRIEAVHPEVEESQAVHFSKVSYPPS